MTTFVHSQDCEKVDAGSAGVYSEIVNKALCDADNVVGMLRWLEAGQELAAEAPAGHYQLVYLMEGAAVITLDGKDYDVAKGNGVYLEPGETSTIRQTGDQTLKLFHLVVPKLDH